MLRVLLESGMCLSGLKVANKVINLTLMTKSILYTQYIVSGLKSVKKMFQGCFLKCWVVLAPKVDSSKMQLFGFSSSVL